MARLAPQNQPVLASAETKLNLSPDPAIKGKDAAVAWFRDNMSFDIGLEHVRKATDRRELPSYLIAGAVWYSTLDLYNWIQRMRRSA